MIAIICVFVGGVCYILGYVAGYCHGGEAERALTEFINDAGGKT